MALVLGTNMGFVTATPSADPQTGGVAVDGFARAQQVTSPAGNQKITEMGWYEDSFAGDPGESWDIGLYDDDSGVPGNLLYNTTGTVTESPGWNSTGVLDWAISGSTTYWLAVVQQVSSPATNIGYVSVGYVASLDSGTNTLVDPWVEAGSTAYGFALYAKYEASATYSELSGTVAAASVVENADLDLITWSSLSGTIAAVSVVESASLGQVAVSIGESVAIMRLVAIGNNSLYYEDIT